MNNRFWELGPFREPPEERSRAGRARKLARLKVDGSSRGSGIGSTVTMPELKTGRATRLPKRAPPTLRQTLAQLPSERTAQVSRTL